MTLCRSRCDVGQQQTRQVPEPTPSRPADLGVVVGQKADEVRGRPTTTPRSAGYMGSAVNWMNVVARNAGYGGVGYGDVAVAIHQQPLRGPMTSVLVESTSTTGPKPLTEGPQSRGVLVALYAFVVVPFLAVLAAVPVAWGGWLSWTDVAIAAVFYVVSGLGITVGFHRYFTHGSFKAKRWLRVALALAGSIAIEGNIIQWVADHRRHHAFSDQDGDPHSPWRYGTGYWALTKGLWFAHMGWMFSRELSNRARFAPDLLADKDIKRVDKAFPAIVLFSTLGPALIGGLLTWSWQGALTAFFWAGIVRI